MDPQAPTHLVEFFGGPWDGERRDLPPDTAEWRVLARLVPAKMVVDAHGEPRSAYHLYRVAGDVAQYEGLIVPRRRPRRA